MMMLPAAEIIEATLSELERALLARFVEHCRVHFGARAEPIVLYGSRSRGDITAESDIDVLVVLGDQPTLEGRDWIIDVALDLALESQPIIDLMPRLISRQQLDELIKREDADYLPQFQADETFYRRYEVLALETLAAMDDLLAKRGMTAA